MYSLIKTRCSRKHARLLLCILLTIITLFVAMPTAMADDPVTTVPDSWQECRDDIEERQGGLAVTVWDMLSIVQQCHPDYNLASIAASIYRFATYSGDTGAVTLMDVGRGLYGSMSVVGLALVFLYFLIEILDEVQADNFNVEHLIKKLLTLMVAILVVDGGAKLFDYIMQFSDALIDASIEATSGAITEELKTLYLTLMNAGTAGGIFSSLVAFLVAIGEAVKHIIPFALFLIQYIVAYLVSFSRFLEVLVRFAFAPVGCAQLVSGGARGPGMRYIKKFASCCLQGAMCVMAFASQTILLNQMSAVQGIFGGLILPITMIGFLMKVGRIADDVVGV